MASNRQMAFANTDDGLVAGAVGRVAQQVKQGWYLRRETDWEFLSEWLNEKRAAR